MSINVDRRLRSAGTSPSLNNYIKSGTVSNGELSLVSVDNGIESTIEVPQFDISPTTTAIDAINTTMVSNSAITTANTSANLSTSDALAVTNGVISTVQADLNGTYTSSSVLNGVLKMTKKDATFDELVIDELPNFNSSLLCHYDGTVSSNSIVDTTGTFSTGTVNNIGSVFTETDSLFGPYFSLGSSFGNPYWTIPGSFGDSISNKATFSFLFSPTSDQNGVGALLQNYDSVNVDGFYVGFSNGNKYYYTINGITGHVTSPSGLAVDKWNLLTIIFNGIDFKFYENGDLFHTLSESSATFSGTYYLGGQSSGNGYYPKCHVASVLVLNDAPDIHKLIDYQIKKLKSVKVPLYFKQSFLDGRSIVDLESETEQLKQGLYSVHCDDANKSIVFKNKPGNIWHNVIFNNDFDVTHTDNGQSNGFGNSTTIALASSSVSSLTLEADGKDLIFQNSEGTVNNISLDLYTKSEVDALVTGSGGTNVTLNGDSIETTSNGIRTGDSVISEVIVNNILESDGATDSGNQIITFKNSNGDILFAFQPMQPTITTADGISNIISGSTPSDVQTFRDAIEDDFANEISNVGSSLRAALSVRDTAVGVVNDLNPGLKSVALNTDKKSLIFNFSDNTSTTMEQEIYNKDEIDALLTPMSVTDHYKILAGDLPGLANGREEAVYREIFPKFKSNELTFVIAFQTIEIINGSGARNSDVNAPFIEITHNNTTTSSSNQIVAIKRTTARPDKLQIFSHNTQLDTSSNVNCYEDVLIDSVVAGARYYLTFSCGNSGAYEFNLFQIIGGVVNIIQNYEHGPSIVLKYRHRTPYYVTINGDLSDKLGMGVDYEQFDMLFKYKTQAQLQALCLEIDGTL